MTSSQSATSASADTFISSSSWREACVASVMTAAAGRPARSSRTSSATLAVSCGQLPPASATSRNSLQEISTVAVRGTLHGASQSMLKPSAPVDASSAAAEAVKAARPAVEAARREK